MFDYSNEIWFYNWNETKGFCNEIELKTFNKMKNERNYPTQNLFQTYDFVLYTVVSSAKYM